MAQTATEVKARSQDVPARSAEPKTPATPRHGRPDRPEPRVAPATSGATATLADVGAGVAFFVALRFLVPRLLRRL